MEVASLFGCAVTTGFGVAENNAKLRLANRSSIRCGWGRIEFVQAAALRSAYPIIAVDLYDGDWNWPIPWRDPRDQLQIRDAREALGEASGQSGA